MTDASLSRTMQLFHRIVLPLSRMLEVADRRSGCTAAQLSVLAGVKYFGAVTLTRLAAHEKIAVPTASRIVDGLVRSGLLSRIAETGDRRAMRLAVTPRGFKAIEVACAAREEALARAFAGLSAEEERALRAVTPGLNRVLGLGPDAIMPEGHQAPRAG